MGWGKRMYIAKTMGEQHLMLADRAAFREAMRQDEERRREEQVGPLREAVYALSAEDATGKAKPRRAAKRR